MDSLVKRGTMWRNFSVYDPDTDIHEHPVTAFRTLRIMDSKGIVFARMQFPKMRRHRFSGFFMTRDCIVNLCALEKCKYKLKKRRIRLCLC